MLAALIEAVVPPGRFLRLAPDPDQLGQRAVQLMSGMPWELRLGLLLVMELFEWTAVFRYLRPFSRLDLPRRVQWAHAWSEHRLTMVRLPGKLLFSAVKPMHFARADVQEEMGHDAGRLSHVAPARPSPLPADQIVSAIDRDTTVRCQVVVVGTGAGGAVVGAELAARGVDVVFVEEGRIWTAAELGRDPFSVISGAYRDAGATFAVGRPGVLLPIGTAVGGTTVINSGTCFRLPARIREKWRQMGLVVDDADLDRRYAWVEDRIGVRPVSDALIGGSSAVVRRGAEALGLDHGPLLRNIRGCGRSGVCAFGCPRGGKQSTDVTWMPWALRAGARLYTGMHARKVTRAGGRATGIEATPRGGGPTLRVQADVVVSACGTVPGVPFLARSGVGSRHLGRHLTIHPATKILALMPEAINGWDDTPQGWCIGEWADEGIMFEGAWLPPEYTSVATSFVGERLVELMENYRRLAVFGFLVSDEPRGRVRVGLGGRPVITYWLGEREAESVRRGLRLLGEVFFAGGAERIWLPVAGREEHRSVDSLQAALADPLDPWSLELAAFHPLGTARMAADRKAGVVDPDLQSWEVPGLYVVDGSVFPSSLGVNPQLTIMAWAVRAAEHIVAGFST